MRPRQPPVPLSSPPSQFGFEGVAQGLDLVSQAGNTFERNADVAENRGAYTGDPILKGLATLGQFDEHLTLVSRIADALDEPCRLQTLRPPYN